jgi:predicted lipoprotein with Yx(FWY)xxD motif
MSLYVFDKDTNGHSNCNSDCAKEWPPLTAEANANPAGNFSLIKRDDGTLQWAFEGRPLYLFDEDKVPGDVNGDGYSADWHLAKTK